MFKQIFPVALIVFFAGCQASQDNGNETQVRDMSLPQMKKIMIKDASQVDSLRATGLDLITIEKKYVIARVPIAQIEAFDQGKLQVSNASELDFVRRLIEVRGWAKEDLTAFAEMGLDIWEVQEDKLIAQAVDKYIHLLRSEGYSVKIIAKNSLEAVKKQTADK